MARSKNDIERYLNGEMTASEMHALEREALSDPFLAEALEGIEAAGKDAFLFDLKQLNNSVRQRTSLRKPKMISMWNWSIGIAAGLILMALCSVYIISLINPRAEQRLAAAKEADTSGTTSLPKPAEPAPDSTPGLPSETPPSESKTDRQIALNTRKPAINKSSTTAAGASSVTSQTESKPAADVADVRAEEQPQAATDAEIIAAEEKARTAEADVEKKEKLAQADNVERLQRRAAAPMSSSRALAAGRIARGKVIAEEDNVGLPGVNVVIKGTSLGTITDTEGNFEISLPEGNETLTFNFIGLTPVELQASTTAPLTVKMQNDLTQLSEVVVTGYSVAKDDVKEFDTFEMAQPSGGRKAFKQYLENQIQYPVQAIERKVEGKVTIEFNVDVDGRLHDFKVLRGIGYGCDEEVIRAIKNGPAWSPSRKNAEPRQEKVRLRYRFSLSKKK